MDFEREVEVARAAAVSAGEAIAQLGAGERDSWDKSDDSPVTRADLASNEIICDALRDAFPDDAILSEETLDAPGRPDQERVWIVDPLDGTKEFVEGVPQFAVSVALAVRGEPAVGVVYQPLTRECFWGVQGLGAHLDDQRIHVTSTGSLEESVVLSSRTEMKRGQLDTYAGWFRGLDPIGSVALKLALIAAGRGDLWISVAPKNEWDVCAGDLLVREAGGTFLTLAEGPRVYNQTDVLLRPPMAAGPPDLVEAFRARSAE